MLDETPFVPEIALDDLMEIIGDDPESLKDIIESFLEDSPKLLDSIDEGVATKDETLVERSSHTLKSNSRLFQAENFALQCQDIEKDAQESDWDVIAEKAQKLRQNFALLTQLLASELNKL